MKLVVDVPEVESTDLEEIQAAIKKTITWMPKTKLVLGTGIDWFESRSAKIASVEEYAKPRTDANRQGRVATTAR